MAEAEIVARDDLPVWALAIVAIAILILGLGSCDDLLQLRSVAYSFDS